MTVWIGIDTETTGLDEKRDGAQILEVAIMAIDAARLEVIERATYVLRFENYSTCDPWAETQHTASGLLDECRGSDAVCGWRVEDELVKFIARHTSTPEDKRPIFGSTVGFDRRWLDAHMPRVSRALHYRSVDVSTVKEIVRAWCPDAVNTWEAAFPKDEAKHRAAEDLTCSLEELRFYQSSMYFGPLWRYTDAITVARRRLGR